LASEIVSKDVMILELGREKIPLKAEKPVDELYQALTLIESGMPKNFTKS